MGGVVSARIRGTRIHIVTDFSECVLLGNTNCVIHTEDKRTEDNITIYNVVLVHKQVLPAHQCWKLVIMYACLSWLSLRCWMWKHYATCVGTIITWLECGLCKGGTVVPCVVVLTWVWNNKRKVAAEWMKGTQVKWELRLIDSMDSMFLGLALHVRIRSHQNDRTSGGLEPTSSLCDFGLHWCVNYTTSIPVPSFVLPPAQYLGSSFTKTTLSISNMKVSEIGKVTYENWLVITYLQCLLRTVYSLLQSAWIQFSHKLLTF